jgi:hypothetical protein
MDVILEDIYPDLSKDKIDYLINTTKKISKFIIKYYANEFDPTISYSNGEEAHVDFSIRKNAVIGYCMRIPRIIIYNKKKAEHLDYPHLIELASHECVHLVYTGHGKNFQDAHHLILTKCIERIEQYKQENNII